MNASGILHRGTFFSLLAMPLLLCGQDIAAWEDIHFESGSSTVVEGFSSLARLADREADLKKKYIAALDAYQAMIDTVTELRSLPKPPALGKINVTYLPLQFMPDKITSDKLLEANNSALTKTLIQLLKTKHSGVETREGPFIVSYVKPLIGLDRIEEHLFIDMSRAPSDAATLYVRGFLTQASEA
jgi:hypothetical protein